MIFRLRRKKVRQLIRVLVERLSQSLTKTIQNQCLKIIQRDVAAPIVQSIRVSVSRIMQSSILFAPSLQCNEAIGEGILGQVAQWLAQESYTLKVAGSSPALTTIRTIFEKIQEKIHFFDIFS